MPIVVQSQSTQPNKTITFDFPGRQVLSYVVGVAYWKFTFGSSDHHVRSCALNLASNKTESSKVTVKVTGTLSDSSGNNIKESDSTVTVSIIAVLDSPDSQLALGAANAIANNSASSPIALPSSSLSIASALLAGWELSFGGDHHVHNFLTAAGFSANGSSGQITAQAQMSDSSGNSATTASINGGLIAATANETGLLSMSQSNLQTTDSVTVEFNRNIGDSVVFLQSVDMQFDGDHHVKSLGGGVSSWASTGTGVKLANARAFMSDDSGHNEVGGSSSVNLVVVALPA